MSPLRIEHCAWAAAQVGAPRFWRHGRLQRCARAADLTRVNMPVRRSARLCTTAGSKAVSDSQRRSSRAAAAAALQSTDSENGLLSGSESSWDSIPSVPSSSSDESGPVSPPSTVHSRSGGHRRPRPRSAGHQGDAEDTVIPSDAPSSFEKVAVDGIQAKLLLWYFENFREMPWRLPPRDPRKPNCSSMQASGSQSAPGAPYAVWISEVMSQQTRISVVREYWRKWMSVFPTVHALANASQESVNEVWAGLGYYRRARFLREGAIQLIEDFDGRLPRTFEQLKSIKGIGSYTAGAIASIAYGVHVPAVDGNVERVLSRLLPGIGPNRDPSCSATRRSRHFDTAAAELVMGVSNPGDFNQALMELGATICTPRRPRCDVCPLQAHCGTKAEAVETSADPGLYAERYPVKPAWKKTKVRDEHLHVLVITRDAGSPAEREYLLIQRPADGLLGGLWECPNVCVGQKEDADTSPTASENVDGLLATYHKSLDFRDVGRRISLGETQHVFSHIRQKLTVCTQHVVADGCPKQGNVSGVPYRWLGESDISESAVAAQMRKVLKLAYSASKPRTRRLRKASPKHKVEVAQDVDVKPRKRRRQ